MTNCEGCVTRMCDCERVCDYERGATKRGVTERYERGVAERVCDCDRRSDCERA